MRDLLARGAVLALLLGSTVALAPPSLAEGTSTASAPAAQRAEQPFWSDEFDGPAGVRPDRGAWNTEVGNRAQEGWWNDELQYYTGHARNSATDGRGRLRISARHAGRDAHLPCWPRGQCDYTSARLTTEGKVSLTYGRVDVRAKLPTGRGLLPAIWMLGETDAIWPAQGEIDVVEVVGDEPRTAYGTAHGPGYYNEEGLGRSTDLRARASDRFRVYSVVKQPERIQWLVDGRPYFTLTPDDLPARGRWVFERSMHLLLDVAVGGDWPGDPNGRTRFPATMTVDYVRMYGSGLVDGELVGSVGSVGSVGAGL